MAVITNSKILPIQVIKENSCIFLFGLHLTNTEINQNSIIFCDYEQVYEYELDNKQLYNFYHYNTAFIKINISDCKIMKYVDTNEEMSIQDFISFCKENTSQIPINDPSPVTHLQKVIILCPSKNICSPVKSAGIIVENVLTFSVNCILYDIDISHVNYIHGISVIYNLDYCTQSYYSYSEFIYAINKSYF